MKRLSADVANALIRPYNYTLIFFLILFLLAACQGRNSNMHPEVATLDTPAISPSGLFTLVIHTETANNNDVQFFEVRDRNGGVLYTSSDRFSVRHTTYFLWDSADRIWVYSGDVGTFFWEQQNSSNDWKKYVYAENNVPAPQFLKDMRPRFYTK